MNFSEESNEVADFISELISNKLVKCVARVGRITSFYPNKEYIERIIPLERLVNLVYKLCNEHIVMRIVSDTGKYSIIAFKYHEEVFIIVPNKNMDLEVIGLIRLFFYKNQLIEAEK